MERYSASLAIREMHIKTTMRYHSTPTKVIIIKKIKGVLRIRRNRNPRTLLVGMSNGAATLESNLTQLHKVKHKVTLWCSSSTPTFVPKRIENRLTQKLIHNFNSSIIHNNQEGNNSYVLQLMSRLSKIGIFVQ